MNDLLVQPLQPPQPTKGQGNQHAHLIAASTNFPEIIAKREWPPFKDFDIAPPLILSILIEALVSTLMWLNDKHYSKNLLNVNLYSSGTGIIPGYKCYQGRQFSFSDGFCDWFIASELAKLDIPIGLNALFRESPNFDWHDCGISDGLFRYRCRRDGIVYDLYTYTPLIFDKCFLSLAGNIAGLTRAGITKKICEKLDITSWEGLLHFNNPSDWCQAVSPPSGPPPRLDYHYVFDQSGFICEGNLPYRNPDGSIQGFVKLYRHKEYGDIFVPSTCWFHKDRPNDLRWVHLGFKEPMLWNLDMIEQNPNATIYIFEHCCPVKQRKKSPKSRRAVL